MLRHQRVERAADLAVVAARDRQPRRRDPRRERLREPRDRRAAPRGTRSDGEPAADPALPAATLDAGLSEAELASAGTRRSLLGRVGGWFSGRWRRDAP